MYLEDEQYRELMWLSKVGKTNYSSLVRKGVNKIIEESKKQRAGNKKWGEGFIGAVKGGPKDLSSKIDYYLYGKGNPKWAGR